MCMALSARRPASCRSAELSLLRTWYQRGSPSPGVEICLHLVGVVDEAPIAAVQHHGGSHVHAELVERPHVVVQIVTMHGAGLRLVNPAMPPHPLCPDPIGIRVVEKEAWIVRRGVPGQCPVR